MSLECQTYSHVAPTLTGRSLDRSLFFLGSHAQGIPSLITEIAQFIAEGLYFAA